MKFNPLVGIKNAVGACFHVFRRRRKPDTVVIYAYPKFIYFWPIWFLGFALWAPVHFGWISSVAAGWTYIAALTIVMVALGFELSRNEFIFAVISIGLCWFIGLWLRDAKHFVYFSLMMRKFYHMRPDYSPNFGLVVSIIMSVMTMIMLIKSRLNDLWEFSSNSIEHYQLGQQDLALTRGAKTVQYVYPDTAELFLCGAGTILIRSANGTQILRRIENIPFLRFREKRLDRLFESVSVRSSEELEIEATSNHETDDHSNETDVSPVEGG